MCKYSSLRRHEQGPTQPSIQYVPGKDLPECVADMSRPSETKMFGNYSSTSMSPIHLYECAQTQEQLLLIHNNELFQEARIVIDMNSYVLIFKRDF
jgi:hypothetical protein